MTAVVTACLGKLPIHGDFIRLNQQLVPEIVEFDQWMLDGMERAFAARGRTFEAELRALPPLRFLYQGARSGRVLGGVVVPSQDQVGRPYPCTLGFLLGPVAAGPEYDRLPLATAGALDAALDLLRSDLSGVSLPEFAERVQALSFAPDEQAAEQQLRSFLFGTTIDQVLAEWPGFGAPARRAQFLLELRRLTDQPFPPRYLTAMPTGSAGEVAFWLTLLRQWLPVRRNPSLLLWPAGPERGALRLLLDETNGRYFGPAFWPTTATSHVLDLGRQHPSRTEPPSGEPLLKPRALLQDVILAAGR